ncbi:MAG: signal peptidase I [Clostridia bacterium]|nr:signal peptidase I [Clostridia bacterium]
MSVKSFIKELLQWVEAIVIAIVIALLIRGLIFEPVIIDGSSMNNTLYNKDRVILNKIGMAFKDIEVGDIIVLEVQPPTYNVLKFLNNYEWAKKLLPTITGVDYIKRVVAVEGDTVEIKNGYLYINGIKQNEEYIKEDQSTKPQFLEYPYVVPAGEYFVMGDNRLHSTDSREFGSITKSRILGRVNFRIWPLNSFGKID